MASTQSSETPRSTRTSVSIPADDYRELEVLAEQKKVTIAWLIRDAVDQYLAVNVPLFRNRPR